MSCPDDRWDEYAACVAGGRSVAETGQPFPSHADWLDAQNTADSADSVHEIGLHAAVDALMDDSGLPRYGPHRHAVERRQQLAFTAYLNSIASHPQSASDMLTIISERDQLRELGQALVDGWRDGDLSDAGTEFRRLARLLGDPV